MVNRSLFTFLLFCLTIGTPSIGISQTLTVSSTHLNFGNVYENSPDSIALTIFNNLGHAVNVTGVRFYTIYGQPAFSASSDHFSIQDGSSQLIWIKFSPLHNVFHNSELVIENDALRGTVSVDLKGQGKFSNVYYDSTENRTEEDLKSMIHYITGIGYDTLGYSTPRPNARDTMFMWLDNQFVNGQGAAQNTVECIYTGRLAVGYVDRVDCQNTATYNFNTEHTFPQGFFDLDGIGGGDEPMRSDLHHLFPTDNPANNYRGDNPFGVVSNPAWSVGGSKGTTTLFEPRDQQKGITARAMMYFVLRYQDYTGFFAPQETILRTWHAAFSPTTIEKKRNADIYLVQHNRNPFVDYPQFNDRITSFTNLSVAPVLRSVDLTEDTIVYGFVQQSVPNVFHYTIVNNGNTAIHFTNFSLTNPGVLSFQTGGNDTVIAAGDALGLNINLTTSGTGSIQGSLVFHTDVPGNSVVTIPIYANDSLVSTIREISGEPISIYPNPVNSLLTIRYPLTIQTGFTVYNLPGNEVLSGVLSKNVTAETIDVSMLAPGVYFLKTETGSSILFQKFMKQ